MGIFFLITKNQTIIMNDNICLYIYMCVCVYVWEGSAVRALNQCRVIPAGPLTTALQSRPSWTCNLLVSSPQLSLGLPGPRVEALPAFSCCDSADPAPGIFGSANAAACLVVPVSPACEGGFHFSDFCIFLRFYFCLSLSVLVKTGIRIPTVAVKGLSPKA